jgi:hypothetical protein
MSGVRYEFDGLQKWEKSLSEFIEQKYPSEFRTAVLQIAAKLQERVKINTPVKTGNLRDTWRLGQIERRGEEYYIEVYTNTEYAEAVEYGHRVKGGGFVPGRHMMEVSLEEVRKELPNFLQNWLNHFLSTHDF